LKPYQCRHADCRELKFSSNACLFRHEREAHGMHAYGKNPHRCHFTGCERAIEGFPRRWNLYDHMRRVHKYDASQFMDSNEDYSDYEVPSKRKGSGAPSSTQMKRTSSSQAKARATSASYSRDDQGTSVRGYQSRQAHAQRTHQVQNYNLVNQQAMNIADRSIHGYPQPLYDSAVQMPYGFPYSA
jgi:hypothetical protein